MTAPRRRPEPSRPAETSVPAEPAGAAGPAELPPATASTTLLVAAVIVHDTGLGEHRYSGWR